jgi:hypothetical protein
VARVPGKTLDGNAEARTQFRLGYIFEYTTEWFPIGHSLGNLTYSLPLAPGEIVKVAVVDWSRSDAADRSEDTGFSESLQHRQLRDRSLSENVSTMLDEWQRGGSVMGGAAVSGGANGGAYSAGGAASLGGAYTTSSGTRNLTAETSQQVSDAFHQSTSAMRELRSTVVIHDSQKEDSKAQTRIVANYNHGHALTILYYEVLRHYRVVTRLANARLALLVNYAQRTPNFTDDAYLLSYRSDIEAMLVDQTLKPCFDAVANVSRGTAQFNEAENSWSKLASPGDVLITQMVMEIATSEEGEGGTDGNVRMQLTFLDNTKVDVFMAEPSGQEDPRVFDIEGTNVLEGGQTDAFALRTQNTFQWKALRGFLMRLDSTGRAWRPARFKLVGRTPRGDPIVLYDSPYERDIAEGQEAPEIYTIQPPAGVPEPVIGTFVRASDVESADRLKNHLTNHKYEYSRTIWLNENVNSRAVEFDTMTLRNQPILDLIENKAIEITGNWVAFPVAAGGKTHDPARILKDAFDVNDDEEDDNPREAYVEQLLSLPTRGVFAEAKLGNCNANEIIDDTRFWDWQKSPIPYQAPEILPADTASRDRETKGLAPTQFPQSVVNIVSPQSLPDPTAMSAAMKAIETPGIFRDMSASQEVGTLLGKLSDNATAMASQAMKQGSRDQLLKSIRESPELTKDQKDKLVGDVLANEVASTKEPNKPNTSTSTGTGTSTTAGGEKPGNGGQSPGGTGPTSPQQGTPTTGPTPSGPNPTPTPSTPKPLPPKEPSKPLKPNPLPGNGLLFQLRFHGALSEQEVLLGLADVTVAPLSKGIRPDGSSQGYVPGITIGPAPANLQPQEWRNVDIIRNSILLHAETVTGPGTITIGLQYSEETIQSDEIYNSVYKYFNISAPVGKPLFHVPFEWFNNSTSYELPAAGNRVILDVKPETKSVSVTRAR